MQQSSTLTTASKFRLTPTPEIMSNSYENIAPTGQMEWPLTLKITEDDILAAKNALSPRNDHSLPDSPVIIAIERSTGSCWQACGISMLKEEKSPYRTILLSWRLRHAIRDFYIYGRMDPCDAEIWFRM